MPYSCTGVHAAFRLNPSARPKKRFYNFDRIHQYRCASDVDRLLANLWIINILILAVLLLDSILLFLHQRRIQEQKRIHMIEQYVPIVEELISQVRARQHEFNNRMMAIEAAVTSADTIEEARKEVTALTGSIGISLNDRELLSCDSKMIAGMLFGKIKQAEVANLHIELSLHGLFKKTVTPETGGFSGVDSFQSGSATVKY